MANFRQYFQCIFLNENILISNTMWLKFVPKGPIVINSASVQIMTWHRTKERPLSTPMMAWVCDAYMHHSAPMICPSCIWWYHYMDIFSMLLCFWPYLWGNHQLLMVSQYKHTLYSQRMTHPDRWFMGCILRKILQKILWLPLIFIQGYFTGNGVIYGVYFVS